MTKHRRHTGGRPSGLTLIELMVASTIIVILILIVGRILVQVQQVVRISQATIRGDQKATAIRQVLIDDLRRVTQHGFLCIGQASDGKPFLMVSKAGPTVSVTGGTNGNGGIAGLGMCRDRTNNDMTWHCTWVLNRNSPQENCDYFDNDLADVQKLTRVGCNGTVDYLLNPTNKMVPIQLNSPVQNLADVSSAWKVLSTQASELQILWSDNSVYGRTTRWRGIRCISPTEWKAQRLDPKAAGTADWVDITSGELGTNPGTGTNPVTEYLASNKYRALFTRDNQSNWPQLIWIRFKLTDPEAPAEFAGADGVYYEIICPVGQ